MERERRGLPSFGGKKQKDELRQEEGGGGGGGAPGDEPNHPSLRTKKQRQAAAGACTRHTQHITTTKLTETQTPETIVVVVGGSEDDDNVEDEKHEQRIIVKRFLSHQCNKGWNNPKSQSKGLDSNTILNPIQKKLTKYNTHHSLNCRFLSQGEAKLRAFCKAIARKSTQLNPSLAQKPGTH